MKMRANEKARSTGMFALVGVALATLVASCAATDMTSTWTDPAAKANAPLSKIAVVALTKDPGLRRMAEDTTAANLKGAKAYSSYQVVSDEDLKDREVVKAKLKAAGMDGVLVMHMTGVTQQVTADYGAYGTFDGYYDMAYGGVYAPGYLETDTIVHMVSNLYDLNQNKLIWSGVSQTFDPASAKSYMNDVSKAVAKQLEKERLIL